MGLIELVLNLAATRRFLHRLLHRVSDGVGVEDRHALDVTGGTTDRLDERTGRAQEAFFIGI